MISNLLVTGRYFVQLDRKGAPGKFTDAIFKLSAALSLPQTGPIYIADWGIYEPLVYLEQGRVPLEYLPALPSAEHPTAQVSSPDALFVVHTAPREIFPGARARLENIAASRGLQKRLIQTIPDSNGRPVFELWRFVASKAQ